MKDKKTDVKSLVEFKKAVVEFGNKINGFVEELSKVLNDIEIPDEEEDTWEMKCPYEYGDKHYCIQSSGDVFSDCWEGIEADNRYFSQGNIFPTEQAARLEAKRRNLLTRFRAFRDECNGDWKINWNDVNQGRYIIKCGNERDLYVVSYWTVNEFNLFGYFNNKQDAQRAVDLFGDEIKELYVDCEG